MRRVHGDPAAVHLALLPSPARLTQDIFLSEVNRKAS